MLKSRDLGASLGALPGSAGVPAGVQLIKYSRALPASIEAPSARPFFLIVRRRGRPRSQGRDSNKIRNRLLRIIVAHSLFVIEN